MAIDAFERWCIFYDCDSRVVPVDGPAQHLHDYADAIVRRALNGDIVRTYERDNRVARIADARRVQLRDGSAAVAFVVTVGDKRGAIPAFVHFERGAARDAEIAPGEVKGASCHCILGLTPNPARIGRYGLLVEETPRMGRSPLEALLNHELREQANIGNDRFVRRDTGSEVKTWLHIDLNGRQSEQMAGALERGSLLPVELIDTSVDPVFDEDADFRPKEKRLFVTVQAEPGLVGAALERLKRLANGNGYDRMRVRWTPPGQTRPIGTEIPTDLADVGTALFAKRELIGVDRAMSECSDTLVPEFVAAMIARFE